ncbi:futalosine hydrolase [Streptomyces sp. BI20]|uniref:futalosine hydrolase n=1 Tax=Streptomyces sp. BI20 TaxID=3403460 RepID=UPI003C78A38B
MRVLVVTAVAAEAEAVVAGLSSATDPGRGGVPPEPEPWAGDAGPGGPRTLPGGYPLTRRDLPGLAVDVLVGGVGPAAAAAGTATALALAGPDRPYAAVVSAGIGGGFVERAPVGSLVVADRMVAADLGAQDPAAPTGFRGVDELGFGRGEHRAPVDLSKAFAVALGVTPAPVVTVSTVTGTAERAAELAARHPGVAAEAMEGFGVAEAAVGYGLPVVEVRAVSNAVGPRDRDAWRIGPALAALTEGFRVLGPVLASWGENHDRR